MYVCILVTVEAYLMYRHKLSPTKSVPSEGVECIERREVKKRNNRQEGGRHGGGGQNVLGTMEGSKGSGWK